MLVWFLVNGLANMPRSGEFRVQEESTRQATWLSTPIGSVARSATGKSARIRKGGLWFHEIRFVMATRSVRRRRRRWMAHAGMPRRSPSVYSLFGQLHFIPGLCLAFLSLPVFCAFCSLSVSFAILYCDQNASSPVHDLSFGFPCPLVLHAF
jgi:hypothetical protein